ncbi:transporter substrate-binding domain-containing protein [Bradyrhizobium murdochi]|uniref:transporter substrate-binding domain-containing protein n=1 Tax=Bradyrhizobium murdochi TaxID=1038859 RepID=UPI000416F4DF|nr:transporter substrate-binding domain-containing protein [Bradyrhizobium murdochi]
MRITSKLSLLVLLLALAGSSRPTSAQTEDPLFASIRKSGQVKVALHSLPPYMMVSPSGEPMGTAVELQNLVLKAMGLPSLTAVFMGWDAMMPGLMTNRFDYIGAGLTITEERCKVAVFSAPYYASQTVLYVLPGNPKHLTGLAEIARRPDIKMATVPSPYEKDALRLGVKPEQIQMVPDYQAGIATVTGGRADAFVVGQFTVSNPEQKGVVEVVDEESPVTASAMVFRKENVAFRDAYSKHLSLLLRNGTFQKIFEKYGIANGEAMVKTAVKFSKASDLVPSCE